MPHWGSINNQQLGDQQLLTGPSTNGRSSAFGALCLGSNPSGPARKIVLGPWLLVVGNVAAEIVSVLSQRPRTDDQRRFCSTQLAHDEVETENRRFKLWLRLRLQQKRR